MSNATSEQVMETPDSAMAADAKTKKQVSDKFIKNVKEKIRHLIGEGTVNKDDAVKLAIGIMEEVLTNPEYLITGDRDEVLARFESEITTFVAKLKP